MTSPSADRYWRADKIGSAIAVVGIHLLVGYALSIGGKLSSPQPARDARPLLTVLEPIPPPPPQPPPSPKAPAPALKSAASSQRAAPPLPKSVAAPIAAPQAPTPPIGPPTVTGTIPAGSGADGTDGGAGGAGGAGSGTGAGAGNGEGFTGARQTRGSFRNSDFPASVRGAGRLRIGVRYAVGPAGRVDRCEIIDSSGYSEVDEMTCRVIVERYRFKPARDTQGFPITQVMEEDYTWIME